MKYIPVSQEIIRQNTAFDEKKIRLNDVKLPTITENGNGRTARLMSGYILDCFGYGFAGIGSLEEYFAYDLDEYY